MPTAYAEPALVQYKVFLTMPAERLLDAFAVRWLAAYT
jgi:hypothetical protein